MGIQYFVSLSRREVDYHFQTATGSTIQYEPAFYKAVENSLIRIILTFMQ